jgi:hypothetical protein
MNLKSKREDWALTQFKHRAVGGMVALFLLPLAAWSGGVVTNCTEANLRAAMAGGGSVTFACDGVVMLTGTITIASDTALDANGHQVTISGNNAVRVFSVETNVNFTVDNLTLANGSSDSGAAIVNAGTVRAINCVFSANTASSGPSQLSAGGAVRNSGLFVASRCAFRQNEAAGWLGYVFSPDPGGGESQGGAICNVGVLFIENSDFVGNKVRGGVGAVGYSMVGTQVGDGGPGSAGGSGYGGAIFNAGVATLVNSTLVSNTCTGGEGGGGGSAAFYFTHGNYYYLGNGGEGGNGGSGLGGGIYTVGHALNFTNCTVARSVASAGVGGAGGQGTFWGVQGTNGIASGGIHGSINSSLVNNLLATNTPGNCSGDLSDLGHNLSSDGSCAFTNTGSLNNTDPLLGPLANNGGPTLTMALLPGSPAIDAGDNSAAPPTDQRGFPRPVGPAVDIGAYELCYLPVLRAMPAPAGMISVTLFTTNDQTCRLFTSTDMATWQSVATNQIGPDGTAKFQEECDATEPRRFYRVALP